MSEPAVLNLAILFIIGFTIPTIGMVLITFFYLKHLRHLELTVKAKDLTELSRFKQTEKATTEESAVVEEPQTEMLDMYNTDFKDTPFAKINS